MKFEELKKLIYTESKGNRDFEESIEYIQKKIFKLSVEKVIPLIKNIGIIPESIAHDSTEEKIYTKTADILLAKAFQEMGLFSSVNRERSNCADVVARSKINNYSLVGDAKTFRLSRTAKNQKDFKVKSMIDWKGMHDFSVLVSPYYQYPKRKSQIYGQALDGNVCLLSWEHLAFFLENEIKETKDYSLKNIWNISEEISSKVTVKDKDKNANFYELGNTLLSRYVKMDIKFLYDSFNNSKSIMLDRGVAEIEFWKKEIQKIESYNKEEAIQELIRSKKINEKIIVIQNYISSLHKE